MHYQTQALRALRVVANLPTEGHRHCGIGAVLEILLLLLLLLLLQLHRSIQTYSE